jgi:hypothetical protein
METEIEVVEKSLLSMIPIRYASLLLLIEFSTHLLQLYMNYTFNIQGDN